MNDVSLQPIEITIERLGGMGDGIGTHQGKPVYVPRACVGDHLKLRLLRETKNEFRAEIIDVIRPSAQRQTPPCKHFGDCGGCSLQHLNDASYADFKQASLQSYVQGLGLDASLIAPMVAIPEHTRRRIDVKVEVENDQVRAGFYAPKSHRLVDIERCLVAVPDLVALLPALKACLATLKKPGRVQSVSLTMLDHGIDATVHMRAELGMDDKEKLIGFAKQQKLVRIAVQLHNKPASSHAQTTHYDPVSLHDTGKATIAFSGVDVALPPASFLQASREGEAAITQQVVKHLQGCDAIADLYSGCGTYGFALIKQAQRVSAYEGMADMAAAMNNACNAAGLYERMETTVRDLFKRPLSAKALSYFDGVVINPPRNGGLPQMQEIANSTVRKVVMVSCNPATFKRDAKCLLEAGYVLTNAVPIDQFLWSNHLELVAAFEKAA